MKTIFLLAFALCSTFAAQASYLPFFEGIRGAILDEQVAISNAAPFDATEKKQLNTLKVALKTVDKPSTTLKADLTALAKVVAGINKGASNETFSFEFRVAISNYVDVLVETNNALVVELAEANNNLALKEKAASAIEAAAAALAAIQPETDLNGAAKALGAVLKQYASAAKAVTAAVNAKPAPVPAPKLGTLVLEVDGTAYLLQCVSNVRNTPSVGFTGTNGLLILRVDIAAGEGKGTYPANIVASVSHNGQTVNIVAETETATITSASTKVLVGDFEAIGTMAPSGGVPVEVPVKVRFNGKFLFQLPGGF